MSRRPANAVVLDAEGLSKASRKDGGWVRAQLVLAEDQGTAVVVSAVTLTETLRGKPADAAVHRLLKGLEVRPVTVEIARAAGELLGATGRSDTVDAIVAATARACGSAIVLTSDPDDLGALTEGMPDVRVIPV